MLEGRKVAASESSLDCSKRGSNVSGFYEGESGWSEQCSKFPDRRFQDVLPIREPLPESGVCLASRPRGGFVRENDVKEVF